MSKKVKIGVFGAYRGKTMINFCAYYPEAELVAICDKYEPALEECKEIVKEHCANVTMYTEFDKFIEHDMDAVVLANYANEHAPFAIRCLEKGMHVISEVLPCQNLAEGVKLVEAVEKSGKIYAYAENYCYFPATAEMRKLYRDGRIGKFTYGEGEYVHNCGPIWPAITYGDKNHWRNNMISTFYCTHSIGPIIHITGNRPKSVVGFELPICERMASLGKKSGEAALEMITFEDGSVYKSLHGDLCKDNIWYSIYGEYGNIESERNGEGVGKVIFCDKGEFSFYNPETEKNETSEKILGHGGSDYYTMHYFIQKILHGDPEKNSIDVYEAMDMFLPGLMAYKSILNGNVSMEVPDFRKKEDRDKYRNDTACSDRKAAGDMYVPPYSKGEPDIPDEVYEKVRETWLKEKNRAY